jgi:hypothetical protein
MPVTERQRVATPEEAEHNRQRVEEVIEKARELLSVRDWTLEIEHRDEVVVNGDGAIAAVSIFPTLLRAIIFVDYNYPLPEQMRSGVHEVVHMSQHEIISLIQDIDQFVREPEQSLLNHLLHKAIEPACVRSMSPLCSLLATEHGFTELLDVEEVDTNSLLTVDTGGGELKGGGAPAVVLYQPVRLRGVRGAKGGGIMIV